MTGGPGGSRPSTPSTDVGRQGRTTRAALAMAKALEAEGMTDPEEKAAFILGVAVAAFRAMGASLPWLLDAVTAAYQQAKR